MGVYIVGFILSLFLIYYAENKNAHGNKANYISLVAILIPCLIAGLRHETIGTDVRGYVKHLFEVSESSDTIREYWLSGYSQFGWDYTSVADIEVGFALLVFVVQKLFGSMPVLLFIIQAIIIVPIFKGLRAINKTQSVWFGMAVFYLMFFNQSLNMMRQWMAMAILFYAFQFLLKDNYRRYILFLVIATLFHFSAILGIGILAIYQITAKGNTYHKTLKVFLLLSIGVGSILSLDFFVSLLETFGLRYGNYIDGTLMLMPNQFLYRIPIIMLLLARWKYLKCTDKLAGFYVVTLTYDILASQLTSVYAQSGRIGVFFSEYNMLLYPAVVATSKFVNNRRVIAAILLVFLCAYWWYVYVFGGSGETVPYVSIWG